jgi:hypothetical protein
VTCALKLLLPRSASTRAETSIRVATQVHPGSPRDAVCAASNQSGSVDRRQDAVPRCPPKPRKAGFSPRRKSCSSERARRAGPTQEQAGRHTIDELPGVLKSSGVAGESPLRRTHRPVLSDSVTPRSAQAV